MELQVEPGVLLASAPHMLDGNFMHTVIMMCQHTEDGAYGLVVNKSTDMGTDMLLHDHDVLSQLDFPVYWGGPVGLDTLQILHRVPEIVPGGFEICSGVYLGGELEEAAEYVRTQREEAEGNLRLLLGYSGWGEGQLDAELASGAWLPAALELGCLFEASKEATWRRIVRSLGAATEGLADLPPDPSWN